MKILEVFLAALLTAVATGAGALPLLLKRTGGRDWLGISNAMAGGAMVAASYGLVHEGWHLQFNKTVAGVVLGYAVMVLLQRILHGREPSWGEFNPHDARRVFMIMAVMTLHSFTEGVGIGVSFGGGEGLGAFITAAMALHNVPEGLAISLAMVPHGATVRSAAWWSIFSSLPQPLMAVPAYMLVEHFRPILPVGLGFAAGAMVWMVVFELMPESLRQTSIAKASAGFAIAGVLMLALQKVLA